MSIYDESPTKQLLLSSCSKKFGVESLSAPYNVIQVVNEFISRAIRDKVAGMTQRKIQNLVYMAQGEILALNNKSLILPEFYVGLPNEGCFRACKSGPVHKGLRKVFKKIVEDVYEWGDKHDYQELIPVNEAYILIPKTDEKSLEIIDKVWDDAKNYDTDTVVKWLKDWNTPWRKMYEKEGFGTGIPDRILKSYFKYLFEVHTSYEVTSS